jgi:P-type Ca2+ transporter type 2C
MSTIHPFGKQRLLLMKGAPDRVLEHCSRILEDGGERSLTEGDRQAILSANEHYAHQALRLLSFAYKSVESKEAYEEADENELVFICLVGIIDPPREEAMAAVEKCKSAGIRVIMITGDHKATALAIAEKLGITGKAVEGTDLEALDLQKEVEHISVYARVDPEHKVRIVDALQKQGHIVAMTGDGVNDAPALKEADIGVAMGFAGTDVAKESASMILIDDNFSSIVEAVEEGRNIYINLKKFVNYLLSSNAAEVFVIFLSVLLFTHEGEILYALTPIMLLYINVLTDSLPALALGVDPGDPKVMQRPPRKPGEPIINKNMFYNIILIGVLLTIATLAIFAHALISTGSIVYAQTMALTALVVLELVRLAMIRKQYRTPFFSNKWMLAAFIIVMLLQLAALYIPWFATNVFGLVPLILEDWLLIVSVAAITYIVGIIIGQVVRKITGQLD